MLILSNLKSIKGEASAKSNLNIFCLLASESEIIRDEQTPMETLFWGFLAPSRLILFPPFCYLISARARQPTATAYK